MYNYICISIFIFQISNEQANKHPSCRQVLASWTLDSIWLFNSEKAFWSAFL